MFFLSSTRLSWMLWPCLLEILDDFATVLFHTRQSKCSLCFLESMIYCLCFLSFCLWWIRYFSFLEGEVLWLKSLACPKCIFSWKASWSRKIRKIKIFSFQLDSFSRLVLVCPGILGWYKSWKDLKQTGQENFSTIFFSNRCQPAKGMPWFP